MPFLELPDAKLYYEIDDHTDAWTTPETVLFVHGFTENLDAITNLSLSMKRSCTFYELVYALKFRLL